MWFDSELEKDLFPLRNVQTDSETHEGSYSIVIDGSLPKAKAGGARI